MPFNVKQLQEAGSVECEQQQKTENIIRVQFLFCWKSEAEFWDDSCGNMRYIEIIKTTGEQVQQEPQTTANEKREQIKNKRRILTKIIQSEDKKN